jgi:cobalamin biosynthesis Mg chelatase CobN
MCRPHHPAQVKSELEPPKRSQQQPYLHSDTGPAPGTAGAAAEPTSSSSNSSSSSGGGSGGSSSGSNGSNGSTTVSGCTSRNAGAGDSVQKLQRVLQLCDECGVIRQPVLLGGLLLVPLLSWHHQVGI